MGAKMQASIKERRAFTKLSVGRASRLNLLAGNNAEQKTALKMRNSPRSSAQNLLAHQRMQTGMTAFDASMVTEIEEEEEFDEEEVLYAPVWMDDSLKSTCVLCERSTSPCCGGGNTAASAGNWFATRAASTASICRG